MPNSLGSQNWEPGSEGAALFLRCPILASVSPCPALLQQPTCLKLALRFPPLHNFVLKNQPKRMMRVVLLLSLLGGVFTAPFVNEEQAKRFIRSKRQVGYWDPNHAQNVWGYTIQEQANEYWTHLRTQAQYYMDMGNLMFDRSTAK
ncbi:hypothetical protein NFI96_013374 [Prochilodus magdalenae]|nr:hypothetical protein NFI96_013374 [Prochilodus magdalenae]